MVPSGHMSPKMSRRIPLGGHLSSPYSENVIRTSSSPHNSPQGPITFTRALEVTDKIQMRGRAPPPAPTNNSAQTAEGETSRESLYDVNYEISV